MNKLVVLASVTASLALGGCSVFMAAQKHGEEAKTVQACQNKNCFLQLRDTDIIDITKHADGTQTFEFKTRQQSGSLFRHVRRQGPPAEIGFRSQTNWRAAG